MRVKGTLMRTAVVGQFTNLDGAARVATADGHTAAGGDGVGDVGKEGAERGFRSRDALWRERDQRV